MAWLADLPMISADHRVQRIVALIIATDLPAFSAETRTSPSRLVSRHSEPKSNEAILSQCSDFAQKSHDIFHMIFFD
jgi:hypothetical protein